MSKQEMAAGSHGWLSAKAILRQTQIPNIHRQPCYTNDPESLRLLPSRTSRFLTIKACSSNPNKTDTPLQATRKSGRRRTPRHRSFITISTGGAKWHGKWTCDYVVSLRDLQLQDLVDEYHGHKNADVSVSLCVQKHASFGFSVEGRIVTSFTRKCCYCNSPFCTEIDTTFNAWILPSRSESHSPQFTQMGDDPSVIYVKTGHEAALDSLIQDTLRLNTSVNVYVIDHRNA